MYLVSIVFIVFHSVRSRSCNYCWHADCIFLLVGSNVADSKHLNTKSSTSPAVDDDGSDAQQLVSYIQHSR